MLLYGTSDNGAQRRRQLHSKGMDYFKGEWMESGDDPVLSPTTFLVEQPANYTVAPHFHRQNQYQVFVEGGGRLGSSELAAVSVHYAGAYTAYGPLISGDAGLKYFTIRPVLEAGALFSSESRDQMKRGPKRHATSQTLTPLTPAALAALPAPVVTDAIPIGADGMGALQWDLPPGSQARPSFPQGAQGCFVFVLAGSLRHGDQTLGRWENLFASTEAELSVLKAGPEGAQLLLLFVPAKEEVYL